jgi:hypothetical protein
MGASRTLPGARAFAQPHRPLTTIHHMLGEVHPVDHQHRQLKPAKLPPHQLRKLVPGLGREPLAHRAIAGAADSDALAQRL